MAAGPTSDPRRVALNLRLAWPMAGLMLAALAAVWGALWLGSLHEDRSQLSGETRIVESQLQDVRSDLEHLILDYGWWNEAYAKLQAPLDLAWADRNLGAYLAEQQGIDLVGAWLADGSLAWLAEEGAPTAPEVAAAFGAALPALLRRAAGTSEVGPATGSAFIRRGRALYAVAAVAVLPEEGWVPPVDAAAAGRFMFARLIDDELLEVLADAYGIRQAELVLESAADVASVGLPGVEGAPVAFIQWQPGHPGAVLRTWIMPALAAAVLVFALFAGMALRNLRLAADAAIADQAALQKHAERERGERLKNELVSTVSHELRTPLTSISGTLSLIASGTAGEVSPKLADLVALARRNCERLVRLVDDLLDVERLSAHRLELEPSEVRLLALCAQSLEESRGLAAAQGVRLELAPGSVDGAVLADPDRIAQVLTNLLGNAVKFSPSGGTVRVAVRALEGRMRVEIADDGPGIPAAFRERIFQRFAQADSSDRRRQGGSGLGLYIARSIIERHGGTIGFRNRRAGGTAFWFTLPLAGAGEPATPLPDGASSAPVASA